MDVTERLSASHADAQIIEHLARTTPALLFMMDAHGSVTFVNKRWCEATGLPAEQLLGYQIQKVIHPDDVDAAIERWAAGALSKSVVVMQYRVRMADGTYRWIEARSEPQLDSSGEIVQWIGSGNDIDEQRRATAALEFLVESGATVAHGEDLRAVLSRLAEAALESLADVCIVDVFAEEGPLRIVVGSPKVSGDDVQRLRDHGTPPPGGLHPIAHALYRKQSVLMPQVEIRPNMYDIDARRRAWWNERMPVSLASAPIVRGNDSYGAMTMLRMHAVQPFEARDLRILEDVARRAALLVQNIRLNEAVRRESLDRIDQFRRIADMNPQLMCTVDPDGAIDWFNQPFYAYTGAKPKEILGHGWVDFIHPDDLPSVSAKWERALRTGKAFEEQMRIRGKDGTYRWFLSRASCERDANGTIVKWYASKTDIHETRQAARTLRTFARLGEALTVTLGLQETLDAVMHTVIPDYADYGHISLVDDEGELRVSAVYAADEGLRRRLRSLIGKPIEHPDPAAGFISLPLVAGTERRGMMTLYSNHGTRTFDAGDLPFFQELARRIVPAISNAQLYERERRVAQSFQEAALPKTLPDVEGYAFDAIYEAGRAEALVGGDWYDAFTLLDGRIVISIGDVAGAGLRAAVTMANMRQAIRGVAHVHADPGLMLEAADRTLRSEHPEAFVTAFVGVIDPTTSEIAYQTAGHLPPLLVHANGRVTDLEASGLPLGLRGDDDGSVCVEHLAEGSMLVLYTDGLVEATHRFTQDMDRLRWMVARQPVRQAEHPAKAIYDAMLRHGSKDDVAILAVRCGKIDAPQQWAIDTALDERRMRVVRAEILEALRSERVGEEALHGAELVLAELTGNLARYAPGPATFWLTWNDGVPVLHVTDSGPGYAFAAKLPSDPLSETGRGLFLIASLARDFVVTPRDVRGSHSRVVLRT